MFSGPLERPPCRPAGLTGKRTGFLLPRDGVLGPCCDVFDPCLVILQHLFVTIGLFGDASSPRRALIRPGNTPSHKSALMGNKRRFARGAHISQAGS